MSHDACDEGYSADFEDVRKAELEWIARRREAAGLPPPDDDLVGLAPMFVWDALEGRKLVPVGSGISETVPR